MLADWVRVGYQSTVQVTVRNPGRAREVGIEVTHAGEPVTTVPISLRDGETATYEFGVAFADPRRGPVRVAGVSAGKVTVVPADEQSPTVRARTDANGGVGPIAGLVVALLAPLVWRFWPGDG